MTQSELIQPRSQSSSRPRPRICSGGCQFFNPEYSRGRKIAGMGTCDKHDSQLTVQVGDFCRWIAGRLNASAAAASAPSPMALRH